MSENQKNTDVTNDESLVAATPWYKNPKNVALAVTSTIAGAAVLVWARSKFGDGEGFELVDIDVSDTFDA